MSLHLKEIIEDHNRGDRTALAGLGVILVGTVVIPATAKIAKPILKQIIKRGLSISHKLK